MIGHGPGAGRAHPDLQQQISGLTIYDATEADSGLKRFDTLLGAGRRALTPTGLVNHVVKQLDGKYSVRTHTWKEHCGFCERK